MPITPFQKEILVLISRNRSASSWIAGGIPIARQTDRFSADIDIFGDDVPLEDAFMADTATLESAGYSVHRVSPSFMKGSAYVSRDREAMKLEWVRHQNTRFYPLQPDPDFGLVLNPIDLAHNKMDAAIGREEPRDFIDLNHMTSTYLPLGPLIASFVGTRDITPEQTIEMLQRNILWDPERIAKLKLPKADFHAQLQEFGDKLQEANTFVNDLTTADLGVLFLDNGRPVQPDLSRLDGYTRHAPAPHGHWPFSRTVEPELLASRYGIAWDQVPALVPATYLRGKGPSESNQERLIRKLAGLTVPGPSPLLATLLASKDLSPLEVLKETDRHLPELRTIISAWARKFPPHATSLYSPQIAAHHIGMDPAQLTNMIKTVNTFDAAVKYHDQAIAQEITKSRDIDDPDISR